MTSPYKKHLQEFLETDTKVTIDRSNASSVVGKVKEVEDDACIIHEEGNGETVCIHFIAYSDIRGVSHLDHDYENLG